MHDHRDTHLYVAVRRDIPLAHQAVQAVHAGISSARELIPSECIHPSLVLCTVADEAELLQLEQACIKSGIRTRTFIESDMGDRPTALATEPVNGKGRRLFRKLELFKGA